MSITASMVKDLRLASGAGIMECKTALKVNDGDFDASLDFLRKKGASKAAKKADRTTKEGAIAIEENGVTAAMVELKCETDFVSRNEKFQSLTSALAKVVLAEGAGDNEEAFMAFPSGDGEKSVNDIMTEKIHEIGENIIAGRRVRTALSGPGVIGAYIHGTGSIGALVNLACDSDDAARADELKELARDIAMHIAATGPVAIDESGVPADALAREREIFEAQAKDSGKPENIWPKIVEGRVKKYLKEICLLQQPFVKDPDKSVKGHMDEVGKAVGGGITVESFNRFKLGE